ncbi:hypothetical protein [Paenibacillus sp. Marseille-Q4541]|uniref:hypothetical protein n=1 Tax=Paenibacillus sp. Marseille-Q4541 TaxID=2831522 RepID=UPI001BA6D162|nr:hypothetical protein [Paenibacillus sp. Marseille-Q4541]
MYIECKKDVVIESTEYFTKGNLYPIVFDGEKQILSTNNKHQEHVVSWYEQDQRDPFFKEHFKIVTI